MTVRLRERYRIALLRGAWRRGKGVFLRQAGLLVANELLREKVLVFRLGAEQVSRNAIRLPQGLRFGEIDRWEDLPESFRGRVVASIDGFRWNGRHWFGKGRRLWVGFMDDEVADLGWWADAGEAAAHFMFICKFILSHPCALSKGSGSNVSGTGSSGALAAG